MRKILSFLLAVISSYVLYYLGVFSCFDVSVFKVFYSIVSFPIFQIILHPYLSSIWLIVSVAYLPILFINVFSKKVEKMLNSFLLPPLFIASFIFLSTFIFSFVNNYFLMKDYGLIIKDLPYHGRMNGEFFVIDDYVAYAEGTASLMIWFLYFLLVFVFANGKEWGERVRRVFNKI